MAKRMSATARVLAVVLASGLAVGLSGCATQPREPASPSKSLLASARSGNPLAEYEVGMSTLAHARSKPERLAAVAWIRKAAMDDLAMAQDRLGWMYLHGQSVPQNTTTALVWMRRAAERGAPAAQLQLGDLYESGASVPTDLEKSYYWFAIAAKGMPSDVHVIDIAAVQAYASKKAAAVARMLPPARRAAVAARVAQWEPRPSVPYVGVVRLGAGARR